jgi:hypothetical protein
VQTKVKLAGSDWSNKFSLDTVGSGGSMKIKRHGKEVEVCSMLLTFSLTNFFNQLASFVASLGYLSDISLCCVLSSLFFILFHSQVKVLFLFIQIGIQISLSYFSLTKIVEFTPLHLLNNHLVVSK